ncbi:MAG TPA: sigma-54-dependent Fis family transcriptional regulator [bacterium]
MKPRILVVDDEAGLREVFAALLDVEGYDAVPCAGDADVTAALATGPVDMAFVDITLAGESGIDVLTHLRERLPLCPVIMITGAPTIDTATEALRRGAFDYIVKPVRQDTLVHACRLGLEHKALLEEREAYRANLEAIFKGMRDLVVMVDDRMRVVEANRSGLCGFRGENMVGRQFEEVARDASPRCVWILRETLRTGRPMDLDHVESGGHGGVAQVIALSTSPLLGEGGVVTGAVLVVRDQTRLATLERQLKARPGFHGIVGESPAMQGIYALVERLSDVESTVLITGESGTGKELVADAIHATGTRRTRPLVKVNCSALTESLLESELFGHVKGAFTGAVADRVGRFAAADGGTIFLDEIGDISPQLQLRLLRVLQNKEIERVGESVPRRVDVRVVAATNRDLAALIAAGRFREDLYYRLRVVEIRMPPLRERATDIPLLARHFLAKLGPRLNRPVDEVSTEAMEVLLAHRWPGNVRELEHALERAIVVAGSRILTTEDLPPEVRTVVPGGRRLDDLPPAERIQRAIERAGGNRTEAAKLLGWSRRTFYRKLAEHGAGEGESGPPV